MLLVRTEHLKSLFSGLVVSQVVSSAETPAGVARGLQACATCIYERLAALAQAGGLCFHVRGSGHPARFPTSQMDALRAPMREELDDTKMAQ